MSEATASAPPAEPPAEKGKTKTTEYLILAYDEGAEAWLEGPTIKSRSPRKAIESVLETIKSKADAEDAPSKFVAIPKRYWLIEEPGVETQTRIVWK